MSPPCAAYAESCFTLFYKKLFRLSVWALGLGFFLTNSFAQNVTADFASRSGTTHSIPARMFGISRVSLQDPATLTALQQAGMTESGEWANIATVYATSQPDWSSFDWSIQLAKNAGLHPMVTLAGSPPWLQPSPNPCIAMGSPGYQAPPTNIAEWARIAASYVAHLDAKFPGVVHDYQIWNEPELQQSFCVADNLDATRLSTYLALYAAAAAAMKAQAVADGNKWFNIGGPAIAKFSLASEWIPALLSDPGTYPYVNFVSYHMYLTGTKQIGNLMDWAGLYGFTQSTTRGELLYYLEDLALVRKGLQANPMSTPIYVTEYNDNWVYAQDCCRNDPAYGPLWNSVAVVDFLNSVYAGANSVPTKLYYFAGSATPYFCIAGAWDANMDCNPSTLSLYPQFYAYELLASPSYLGLSKGGHMAASVSPVNTQSGLLATAFYTSTQDSIVIVNPTGTSYGAVKVFANHTGYAKVVGTSYTLNKAHPHIATGSVSFSGIAGNYSATVAVPAYSTVAVTIAPVATLAP